MKTPKIFPKHVLVALLAITSLLAGCGDSGGSDGYDYVTRPLPPNPPATYLTARYDSYEAVEDTILQVSELYGVLANDEYPIYETQIEYPYYSDNGGYIEGYDSGAFEYEPPAGFLGLDSFTYTLRDLSGGTSQALVYITVYPIDYRRL